MLATIFSEYLSAYLGYLVRSLEVERTIILSIPLAPIQEVRIEVGIHFYGNRSNLD